MLAAWVAESLDIMEHSEDAVQQQEADDFVQLMTPIIKAFLTDVGTECANLGLQIYGGHGYIQEWGMEQFARDARIAQIYEGTNGIQALDLIGRKMPAHTGRYLRQFFHPVEAYLKAHENNEAMAEFIGPLAKVFGRLQQATVGTATKALGNPDEAGAAATDYLRLFALTALAYLWCRAIEVSNKKMGNGEDEFYEGKIQTARFFMTKVLPQSSSLFSQIMSGSKPLMDMPDVRFG